MLCKRIRKQGHIVEIIHARSRASEGQYRFKRGERPGEHGKCMCWISRNIRLYTVYYSSHTRPHESVRKASRVLNRVEYGYSFPPRFIQNLLRTPCFSQTFMDSSRLQKNVPSSELITVRRVLYCNTAFCNEI